MTKIKIGIHQPNYIPWMGFFKKMAASDIFIILDTAQYTKNGYQNRCKIRGNDNEMWLTQPISSSKTSFQPTNEVKFANDFWKKKHFKSIKNYYSKSKNYGKYIELFESFYDNKTDSLSEFNLKIIKSLNELLNIDTQIVLASSIPSQLQSNERLVELIKSFNGNIYVSGEGALKYMDLEIFNNENITIEYSRFIPQTYNQMGTGFVGGLSILDYIFNEGNRLE